MNCDTKPSQLFESLARLASPTARSLNQTAGTQRSKPKKMSSGFGFKGREGRCYRFWKDVEECSKNTEFSGQCGKQVEDYLECLHHKKEVTWRCFRTDAAGVCELRILTREYDCDYFFVQLTRMNAIVVQKEKQEAAAHRGGGTDEGHGH